MIDLPVCTNRYFFLYAEYINTKGEKVSHKVHIRSLIDLIPKDIFEKASVLEKPVHFVSDFYCFHKAFFDGLSYDKISSLDSNLLGGKYGLTRERIRSKAQRAIVKLINYIYKDKPEEERVRIKGVVIGDRQQAEVNIALDGNDPDILKIKMVDVNFQLEETEETKTALMEIVRFLSGQRAGVPDDIAVARLKIMRIFERIANKIERHILEERTKQQKTVKYIDFV